MRALEDLKRRLAADRRCFAFFHPALPDEPLIFVEVALVDGMADRVQPLIDPLAPVGDPASADAAIFYSINNCLEGLRGVTLGNFLIKLVVADLARELPEVKTYATLSPIPGFAGWLREALADEAETPLADADRRQLAALDTPDWPSDPESAERLRAPAVAAVRAGISPARSATAARATRSPGSTSATAPGSSGSTGWATSRPRAWPNPWGCS